MYTETIAKTKLCPFVRKLQSIPDVITTDEHQHCIASACMAWRWVPMKERLADPDAYHTAASLGLALRPPVFEIGFCGAGGVASGTPPKAKKESQE